MVIKKRILTIISIIGAVTLVLIGLSVFVAFNMAELKLSIDEENRRIDERYVLQRRITESIAGLGETRGRIAELSSVAVRDGEELAFVQALERAADQTGVDLDKRLDESGGMEISEWEREQSVVMTVRGSFANVLRFVAAAERLKYVIPASVMRMTAAGTDAGQTEITLDITATVYNISRNAPAFVGFGTAADEARKAAEEEARNPSPAASQDITAP